MAGLENKITLQATTQFLRYQFIFQAPGHNSNLQRRVVKMRANTKGTTWKWVCRRKGGCEVEVFDWETEGNEAEKQKEGKQVSTFSWTRTKLTKTDR